MPTIDLTTRIEAADRFVANLALDIRHGGARAFYRPSEDFIQMPERVLFENTTTSTATEGYYGVLLHEIGHACGARHRLDRDLSGRFDSASHAMEEMCAEWIAALMCADLGITAQPRPDHAHYIKNWLTTLKGDKSAAMAAAAKASQAAEYLWTLQPPLPETSAERDQVRSTFVDAREARLDPELDTMFVNAKTFGGLGCCVISIDLDPPCIDLPFSHRSLRPRLD